ncbi:MAG: acyltransferase, partial [Bacteroidetes bacterium]|nr:acyltransferase [Bacteroidota bacterium]
WPNASTKQTGASRIRYIDAYRGVAALGVAWFHIYTCLAGGFAQQTHLIISFETLDAALNYFALWGRWGVRLFFVISGFVLAHSLQKNSRVSGIAAVGKYFIKRSIRLDPTYFAAIGITLICVAFFGSAEILKMHTSPYLSMPHLLTNLFYLNWIMDYPAILSVSWTLALEIQLYIFFAIILYIGEKYAQIFRRERSDAAFIVIVIFSALSLLWPFHIYPEGTNYFPRFLFIFLSGVLLYNSFLEKRYLFVFIVFDIILIVFGFIYHDTSVLAIIISHILIAFAHYFLSYRKYIESSFLLYCGKLSYCIYLLHIPIGISACSLMINFIAPYGPINKLLIIPCAIIAILVTLMASHIVYQLVEKKSIAYSSKIRLN